MYMTWSQKPPIPTSQARFARPVAALNAAVEVNILRPESAFGSSQRLDEDDHNFLGRKKTAEGDERTNTLGPLDIENRNPYLSKKSHPLHGGTTWCPWPSWFTSNYHLVN